MLVVSESLRAKFQLHKPLYDCSHSSSPCLSYNGTFWLWLWLWLCNAPDVQMIDEEATLLFGSLLVLA